MKTKFIGFCRKIKSTTNIKYFLKDIRKDEGLFPHGFINKKVPANYITAADVIKINQKIDLTKIEDFLRKDNETVKFELIKRGGDYEGESHYVEVKEITFLASKVKRMRLEIEPVSLVSGLIYETQKLIDKIYDITSDADKPYVFLDSLTYLYEPSEKYIFININNIEDFYEQVVLQIPNFITSTSYRSKMFSFFTSAALFFIDYFHKQIIKENKIRVMTKKIIRTTPPLFSFILTNTYDKKIDIRTPDVKELKNQQSIIMIENAKGEVVRLEEFISSLTSYFVAHYFEKNKEIANRIGVEVKQILENKEIKQGINLGMLLGFLYYAMTYIDIVDIKKFFKHFAPMRYFDLAVRFHFNHIEVTSRTYSSNNFSFKAPRAGNSFLEELLEKAKEMGKLTKRQFVIVTKNLVELVEDEDIEYDFIFIARKISQRDPRLLDIDIPFNEETLYRALSLLSNFSERDILYKVTHKLITLYQTVSVDYEEWA